jgi:hypothetical protein
MRTSDTLGYLLNNVPIRPNREICVIDSEPGLWDALSLTDLISLATSTYLALEGNFKQAGAVEPVAPACWPPASSTRGSS